MFARAGMLHSGLRLVGIVLMAVAVASCSADDTHARHLKLAHSLDTGHPVHEAMVYMAEVLAEVSRGSMQIDIYPSGQLGSERDLVELLQIGSLAMTKVSASPLEGFAPEMKVFSIPYVFRDQGHYWQVLEGDIGRELLLSLERVRLRGLGYYDAGSRSFYTTKRPIHTPADLQGLKIRVQKSQTSVDMVTALGGAPTPIAWGELYTALQQGIVDGAENNLPSFYLSRHYEASKYFTLDEHTSVPDVLLISSYIWHKLDSQQQNWLQQAVDASITYQRKRWREATEQAREAVVKAGVEIIRPDKALFRKAVIPMHESYRGTAVAKILRRIGDVP